MMNRNEVMLPHNAEAPPLKRDTLVVARVPLGAVHRAPRYAETLRWDEENGEPQPLRNSYDNPASQQCHVTPWAATIQCDGTHHLLTQLISGG